LTERCIPGRWRFESDVHFHFQFHRREPTLPLRLPILLAVAYLALRLPGLPRWLEDHDSVNFALALDHFDLFVHRPHFPGYPVYIALAKIPYELGISAHAALALPAVVVGAVACGYLFATVRARAGLLAAVAGVAAYALLPGVWLADLAPRSDALGLHTLTLAVCGMLNHGLRPLVAIGLGLVLGVRLSLLPAVAGILCALVLLIPGSYRVSRLAWFVAGVGLWLGPLVVLAGGPGPFADLGLRFLHGHFYEWGGTAVTMAASDASARAADLVWNVGGWLLGPVGLAGALVAMALWPYGHRAESELARPCTAVALAFVPYALWVALGQNSDHARHVLPLAVPAALLGAGAVRWLERELPGRMPLRVAVGAAVMGLIAVSLPRAHRQATTPSPAVQAGGWLSRQNPEQLRVIAGSECGVLRFLAPTHRIEKAHDVEDLRRRRSVGATPMRDWTTSGVPGVQRAQSTVLASFSGRPGVDRPGTRLDVIALTATLPLVTAEAP
jgi:hypothetical protein